MARAQEELRGSLCDLLREQKDEVIKRWLERVERDHEGEDFTEHELLDSIPNYLDGLAEIIAGDAQITGGGEKLWERVATEHATFRAEQGIGVENVVREFAMLRRVLVQLMREQGIEEPFTSDLITSALDAASRTAIANYVRWRDRQARRLEAEHVSFVTHELRNPLNTARMALRELKGTSGLDPEQERLTEIIDRSHGKLEDLINGVLSVGRAESGELEARPVVAKLRPLLEESVQGGLQTAQAKGLTFEFRCDADAKIAYDPRLLASALQNLVDNAVKYTDDGTVSVWTSEGRDELVVHVRDSCGGLSDDEQQKLFEAFRRGEHRTAPGTGLGLTIAKQAVEAQGGSIRVDSYDTGCHFCIVLPKNDASG